MSSDDITNTANARASLALARAVHRANKMRMASYAEDQQSGVEPSSPAEDESAVRHLMEVFEHLLSSQARLDSEGHVPVDLEIALLQAWNAIVRMRKHLYDKAYIYIYAYQASRDMGALLTALVEYIQRIPFFNPESESQSSVLSPASLLALKNAIQEVHSTASFTQESPIGWWVDIQGQLRKLLERLPPDLIDDGANSDRNDLPDEIPRGHRLRPISIPSSPVSSRVTAVLSQQTTEIESEATRKHPHDWRPLKISDCFSQVERLADSMLRVCSNRAKGKNTVLLRAAQRSKESKHNGSLWRIFKSEGGSPAPATREDYRLLAQLCRDMLEARSKQTSRTIRYVWVHLMKDPEDMSCREASANVLTRALEVLKIFAESMIKTEVDLPSDGAGSQDSSSVMSQGAKTQDSDSHFVNASVAYSYFEQAMGDLTSLTPSSNPHQHGDSSHGL
jgi:hypothetical protein